MYPFSELERFLFDQGLSPRSLKDLQEAEKRTALKTPPPGVNMKELEPGEKGQISKNDEAATPSSPETHPKEGEGLGRKPARRPERSKHDGETSSLKAERVQGD